MNHKPIITLATVTLVAVLGIAPVQAGASESASNNNHLSATQLEGLRYASQSVLRSKKKQREQAPDTVLKQRLREYHDSLVQLQGELLKTRENRETFSVGPDGTLVREGSVESPGAAEEITALIDTVISTHQRAHQVIADASTAEAKAARRVRARRDAPLKKMEEHALQLSQLKNKNRQEQLALVSDLMEQTALKRRKDKTSDKQNSTGYEAGESRKEDSVTPTLTSATRHRR
ncbi:MAG: hypothetical protein BECKG1743D_GA0114223_100023 [Candidatus Kentron sp. G]|nr:MAG: hypothetical protein BECKG1743F_GA0114225_100013 [Candidatus Kentron sp. G]VFM95464.1 MAG: hypothetical protein BECKG1743E_GA0114224_1000415 [Candidatus Kentron sp. G]VFM97058.1 MAG: hypothetical protein BECKG1743D_GA0114223_100023 [Candidatus Kentron sp. G]